MRNAIRMVRRWKLINMSKHKGELGMMSHELDELNKDEFYSFLWDNLSIRDRLKVLNGKKRTVWLFGAGASYHYALNCRGVNMPLARDFFKAMHRLPTTDGFNAFIGPFISFLHNYRGVHPSKASEWADDIEHFMT